jgi:FG-GAP-like repeat
MKHLLVAAMLPICGAVGCGAAEFERPVLLTAAGAAVRVESPGYAAPCWADVDGDGKKDLLVGQFQNGKIRVFKNLGEGNLAAGVWLQAEGQVAEVPGVW